jgi:hypothetical protein
LLATATTVMLRLTMQVATATIGAVRLMGLTLRTTTTEQTAFQFGVIWIIAHAVNLKKQYKS